MSEANLPTVSFSADKTVIIEGGEAQLLTFNLSEPAPVGGLVVNLRIDDPDGESGPGDTEFPPELISNIVDFGQVEEDGVITASLTIAEGATQATFGIAEQLEFNFNLTEAVGEGGLVVNLDLVEDTDPLPGDISYFVEGSENITDFELLINEESGLIDGATVTLAEGATSATLLSDIIADNATEGEESITFGLAESDRYSIDSQVNAASFTILDTSTDTSTDVPTVSLTPENVSVTEGETMRWNISLSQPAPSGGLALSLTVTANNDPAPGDVEYNVDGSSAIADFEFVVEDGVSESFNITIAEGETEAVLVSQAISDDLEEGEEIFTTVVAEGEGYLIDSDQNEITTTISDADLNPTVDLSPIFGTTEADIIEVDGGNQLVFSGDSDDLIDASFGSEGGNRIYGGNGNDTVVLGENDRIFGGEGSDRFFIQSLRTLVASQSSHDDLSEALRTKGGIRM